MPRTKRKRNGCTSEVTIRSRSLVKRIISRCQTILIARSSPRRLCAGTRTARDLPRRRSRGRGDGRRGGHGLPASHHARHHPLAAHGRALLPRRGSSSRCSSMKTSSSDGRETLTERIGTPSSANRRGTNCSPALTPKVTSPSAIWRAQPEALAQRRDRRLRRRRSGSARGPCRRLALSVSGVSSTTIWPLSMIAIRSQYSASSM